MTNVRLIALVFENNTFNKSSIAIAVEQKTKNLCFGRLYRSSTSLYRCTAPSSSGILPLWLISLAPIQADSQNNCNTFDSQNAERRPPLTTTTDSWKGIKMALAQEVMGRGLISPGRVTWVRVYNVRKTQNTQWPQVTSLMMYPGIASCAWCVWKK